MRVTCHVERAKPKAEAYDPAMHPRFSRIILLGSLIATSCSSSAPSPTPGQSLITSSDQSALYAAEPDEGLISILKLDGTSAPAAIQVSGEPTRIARANGRVFVTLRAERAL